MAKQRSLKATAKMAQEAAKGIMSRPPLSNEELAVGLTTPKDHPYHRHDDPIPHIPPLKDSNDEAWDQTLKKLRESAGVKPGRKKR